jgi:hypothetical protein
LNTIRTSRLALAFLLSAASGGAADLHAQATDPQPLIVDTIVIIRDNVFNAEQAATSGIFRIMNSLHVTTQDWWVRNNLLFKQGEPFDSAKVVESERILRQRAIFREIDFDTTRIDDRFAVVVHTQDGWSTKPKFKFQVQSDGTWTGTIGINEINLLGTGNQVYIAYDKQVDRDGLNLSANFQRLLGSEIDAAGNYAGMSDGKSGNWITGIPFRAYNWRASLQYDGMVADQRILQFFRTEDGVLDTVSYHREAMQHNLVGGAATIAQTNKYLRWVGLAGVRDEAYQLEADTAMLLPDSLSAVIGVYGEYSRADFITIRRFNGFGSEDLDLSTTIRLTVNLAPEVWGYERTGVGPGISASTTVNVGSAFVWGALDLSGVLTDAGLDSGRVVGNFAFGWKPAQRHAIMAQIQVGALDNVRPGEEFTLGFNAPPRSWEAHSFVGTRELWISAEHRWFVWDALFNLVGVGFAAFFDYGGAWYPEQERRGGGNIGLGLRLGSALSTVPRTGRLDVGYRFGDDVTGDRWVVTLGTGFVFPRREIPVIQYSAQPPP